MVNASVCAEKHKNLIVLHSPNTRINDPLRQRQPLLQKRVFFYLSCTFMLMSSSMWAHLKRDYLCLFASAHQIATSLITTGRIRWFLVCSRWSRLFCLQSCCPHIWIIQSPLSGFGFSMVNNIDCNKYNQLHFSDNAKLTTSKFQLQELASYISQELIWFRQ